MANHPYISGPGNITQMIGFLRRSFPAVVNSETVKKLGLASKNESYVINVLQFLGLIDEEGKRTEIGHDVMTKHDEVEFNSSFEKIVKDSYSDLFDIRGDDAWTMSKSQLIGYFRSADKTSDIIGGRQAGVFVALRELAGHLSDDSNAPAKPRSSTPTKPRTSTRKPPAAIHKSVDQSVHQIPLPRQPKTDKGDIALTVRIEINLPAEGTQETYDAIFRSIKDNLYP